VVSANGTLFTTMGILGVGSSGGDGAPPQLVSSSNAAHTDWHADAWSFTDSSAPGAFSCCAFINFGKDNAGAPGFPTYVYAYGKAGSSTTDMILIRVPVASIHTKTAYQFFTGTDASGNPQWGALANAVVVFSDKHLNGNSIIGNYDAGLDRYLLVSSHDGGTTLEQSLFDAPNMWGPWTTVEYTSQWCKGHFGTGEDEGVRFTSKWMSNGGQTLFAGYSSGTIPSGSDQLNLVTANLHLNTPPPASTLGVSQLSGLGPDSGDNNTMSGTQITTGSLALPVSSLSVYLATAIDSAPNNQIEVAIYTDSAGKPGTKVVASGSTAAVEGWNTIALTTTLAANTKYWLLYNTNASIKDLNEIDNGALTGFTSYFAAQTFGTWPTTAPTGSTWGGAAAMYVTYSAGTSGTVGVNSPAGLAPDSGDNNTISGMQVTTGGQATHASSLSVFVGSPIDAAPHDQFQVAIYTDASGHPGAPVTTSASQGLVAGWNTVALSANLAANTKYWLLYNTNATSANLNEIDNNLKTGFTSFFGAQTFGTWPSSIAGGTVWGGAAAMVLNFP
jgi:hypothetical protein